MTLLFGRKTIGGHFPVLCRYTSDFDSHTETDWWYIIQDKKFDITELRSSSRRRIMQGLKHFDYCKINPKEYADQMAYVTVTDWSTYPHKNRPANSKEDLIKEYITLGNDCTVYGVFDKVDGVLSGFQIVVDHGSWFSMDQGKSLPEKQKKQVNAGLIFSYIMDLSSQYDKGKFLSNGQRNILHETHFHDDLCHFYGFRKAYCNVKVVYNPKIKQLIEFLYPFRRCIKAFDFVGLIHNINAIMKMEEIIRLEK